MRGLYWKIYFAFILTSVLATLVTLAYAVFYRQLSNETNNLIAPTDGYISSAQLMLQRGGEPLLIEWLFTFEQHPNVNTYVFDQQGSSISGGEVPASVSDYAFSASEFHVKVQPLNRSEILVKAPLTSEKGGVYLLVVEFLHPFAVLDVKSYIALGLSVAIIFFAGIGFLLSGYLSRPMRRLQKTVKAIAGGDLSARSGYRLRRRRDEIGDLSREFDVMADRVQTLLADQKGLLRDISHELRSPLTRLQMALGLAQEDSTKEQAREQYLQRCQREIERLDHMIESVLALSRLENTLHTAESEQVNLSALIQNIINDEQFVADKKSIKIEVDYPNDVIISADQTLLTSAISNVLSNAVKYGPEQSTINVTLSSDKHNITLIISDCGEGVPEQALAQLFTPFYRVNLARDRNTGGTGLGLAIAKQAIIAHQGEIFAKNNAMKGLSVIIQIPYL